MPLFTAQCRALQASRGKDKDTPGWKPSRGAVERGCGATRGPRQGGQRRFPLPGPLRSRTDRTRKTNPPGFLQGNLSVGGGIATRLVGDAGREKARIVADGGFNGSCHILVVAQELFGVFTPLTNTLSAVGIP